MILWILSQLISNDWHSYVLASKRFEGIFGGKIDKTISFEEVLVLSSYMCKASKVC